MGSPSISISAASCANAKSLSADGKSLAVLVDRQMEFSEYLVSPCQHGDGNVFVSHRDY